MTLLETSQGQWPLDGTIFPVSEIDIEVSPEPHPFHLAEADRARESWQREIAANPHLFDGRMVLQRSVRITDGRISARAHIVPYSTFLWWRKTRAAGASHIFGMPMLVSSDGALIAIRMGAHTANPGRVYSPGGSLEPEDIIDGRCDVARNIAREVMEETGISLSEAIAEPGWHAIRMDGTLTVFRVFRLAATAEEILARVAAHVAADPHPEIDEAVAIRGPEPTAHNYPPFIPPILEWLFARSRVQQMA
ncbi:MAG: NUDIX hydrolase [Sinorhizobium meliloti]|jgi:8-oxo-dGTP pyrophosphatase MutT (NUDIX family)|uniref:NUDIX hydrolase n=1 Tax=Rhizobium meliloti TaxID=382 RepID=UPI000FD73404|nr:NUDIX hydrolase [Sinorhizobium meliloti]MCG5486369.1 NUDIX hydrolase [Sinorhizobium meliloti]RVP97013.1 NUDIX hydrolase [Sinorhizobium meliloti]